MFVSTQNTTHIDIEKGIQNLEIEWWINWFMNYKGPMQASYNVACFFRNSK